MRKKLAIAGTAVVAVVLLSGFAFRGGHRWGRDPERIRQMVSWKLNDKLDDLDATDAQRQAINAVKDRLFDEGAKLAEEQHAVRSEVVTQLESATPDAQRLHALVDERIEAMRAFAHKATDAALEVHGTLTPEQRKALATEFRERTGVK
ncbi:Spy/CpxP family protein refolding chaperone [Myxococcus stipitatus]|uniref:Spy/CpxP family protein refolding chaperone n=1 Tax=Myxococcus stipitatus TaxID=83455 RepID=UPI001F316D5E|nr:Spy/CpxP family protein refolding chaperone [Myxococcus stipitatus]MCE9667289.1 Spy/CpxP family protein refolding chaperone [Myxococcus stipitatus]